MQTTSTRRVLGWLAMTLAGSSAIGCAAYDAEHHVWRGRYRGYPVPLIDDAAARDDEHAIAIAEQSPTYVPQVTPPPSRVTPPDPVHARFDAAAATSAIHAIDLAPCAARGAPTGYGHARIAFGDDGAATRVTIDAPQGMGAEAVRCLGDRLATATVDAFEGAPITVGASYYVR